MLVLRVSRGCKAVEVDSRPRAHGVLHLRATAHKPPSQKLHLRRALLIQFCAYLRGLCLGPDGHAQPDPQLPEPIARKGTHKYRRSTASGNDFPDADPAPLTLLGGTSARAQVAASDTAFIMAIHGATLVSMPPVLAVVDPTSIGYADGDPSSRPALAAASSVSVGSCDASRCPGLLFCK